MAVTTTNRVAGPFAGNGATVQFGFSFKVFATTDLLVVRADAEGNLSVLDLGTDYTATLNVNQDVSAGGSITMTTAPPTGDLLLITSDVAELQQVVLMSLGGFYPDVLNGAYDRLTILVQQLQVTASRSIQFPLLDSASNSASPVLPPAVQRAQTLLYFDANGNIAPLSITALLELVAAIGMVSVGFLGVAIVFADTATGTHYAMTFINGARWLTAIGFLGTAVASVTFIDAGNGNRYSLQVTEGSLAVVQVSSSTAAVASYTLADLSTGAPHVLSFYDGALVVD